MKTDAKKIKPGLRKTAKKVVENYPGVSITVVKHEGQEERSVVDVYWIKMFFSEDMVEKIEKILCTIDKLPETSNMWEGKGTYAKEDLVRFAAKAADMRWIWERFAECMVTWIIPLEFAMLLVHVPGQV